MSVTTHSCLGLMWYVIMDSYLTIDYFRSIKFKNTGTSKIVGEEIIEEVGSNEEPPVKIAKIETPQVSKTKKNATWNKGIGIMSTKSSLSNLVKCKKNSDNQNAPATSTETKTVPSVLALLASYSGSDDSDDQ